MRDGYLTGTGMENTNEMAFQSLRKVFKVDARPFVE